MGEVELLRVSCLTGLGGTILPGLPQDVSSESSSYGTILGRFPRSHWLLPKAVDSPHSGNPPGGQGSVRARILSISGIDPEPPGGPSQTTFACALKDLSRSTIELGPRVPTDGPNRVGRRWRHAKEGERSQPIRGAALANGMAAVWGDRFMGWTWNQGRRQGRRRQRPMLELLDDRCLLSASAGINLADHVVSHAVDRRPALVRHPNAGSDHTEVTHRMVGNHVSTPKVLVSTRKVLATTPKMLATTPKMLASTPKEVEKPAGTLITGAATAYDPITGAAATRSAYHVDGTGMTVAVIDTGVDYNNPALGGGFGPNDKVIAGYDFADNTSDPKATTSQHGTAIAGLIGSENPNDLGVAPGVKIVALRVTDDTNTASLSSIANALQWVITNHAEYNITAVNMSLSDGGNYAQNWFANDGGAGEQITQLIGQLTAMNIPVIAATGNSFTGAQGEGFAAIVQGTISVTATDLSGTLLSDAQRLGTALGGASATTIAAPGSQLTAPSGDSGTATVAGTSFATALVTGGVTLLQEIYESRFGELPTVAEIKSWLQEGATPIQDPVTGITLGELNIDASASQIPEPSQASTTTSQGTAASASAVSESTTPTSTSATSSTTSISTSQVSNSSAATTVTSTATSSVQVFVNGQEVDVNSSSTTGLGSLDQSLYQELLQAMSAWGSSDSSGGNSDNTTQIQVWNA